MEKIVGEGKGFERIRRVTGYLAGDVSRFNNVPDVAFWGNTSTLYGDISKLKKGGGLLYFTVNKTANTWSNRPSAQAGGTCRPDPAGGPVG